MYGTQKSPKRKELFILPISSFTQKEFQKKEDIILPASGHHFNTPSRQRITLVEHHPFFYQFK